MKHLFIIFIFLTNYLNLYSQNFSGYVIDRNKEPIVGATIKLIKANHLTNSNNSGYFHITSQIMNDSLLISHVGYKSVYITLENVKSILGNIILYDNNTSLEEVMVSTGYHKTKKENATGSFTLIDAEQINRNVSYDIISRLEGVSSGLQFNRKHMSEQELKPKLRVRGVGTIFSDTEPLIVIDNFPFEGDINNINPEDVNDITILKDAAAAAIWGARAGNGVIVITTKQGKYTQRSKISFNTSLTMGERPDLFYDPAFLNSAALVDYQKELFARKLFTKQDWTLLSPVLELLIAEENNQISQDEAAQMMDELSSQDVRNDIQKYLYRNSRNQRYNLNVSGGGKLVHYITSVGYDQNQSSTVGFDVKRFTVNNNLSYKWGKSLELSSGLYFVQNKRMNNGLQLRDITPRNGGAIQSYTQLKSADGINLSIPYKFRQTYIDEAENIGLLNWQFRPLDELCHLDNESSNHQIRLNSGVNYKFSRALNIDLKYQYQRMKGEDKEYSAPESYNIRDLVNRYTSKNGENIIPYGGIMSGINEHSSNHYGRFQVNYNTANQTKHVVAALAGAEIRQDRTGRGPEYLLYGYDKNNLTSSTFINYEQSYSLRPNQSGRIPAASNTISSFTDRFLSYYLNGNYGFDNRYIFSANSRWDASNVFGVETNQKGVPLWSVGAAWNLTNEPFFSIDLINSIKLRITYGINGNINKKISALPKILYSSGSFNNLPYAILQSTGNPALRWEKVATFNSGLDFSLFNNRLNGSVEYYIKDGNDLIGHDFLDPTTGIIQLPNGRFPIDNRINYADLRTKGIDFQFSSINTKGAFKWSSSYFFSWTENKITKYNATESPTILTFLPVSSNGVAPALEGKSIDILYALPWYGLNPENGNQQVLVNDVLSENYAGYWSSLEIQDLKEMGVSVPTVFGGFLNTVSYKNLSLSANLTFKAGYKFRRSSINYSNLLSFGSGHRDYLARWKERGDESSTTIPALVFSSNTTRENIYRNNELLIQPGAHVRFNDVNLSYKLNHELLSKVHVSNALIFINANNLGIIWKQNKMGLDPDYPDVTYLPSRNISIGLKIEL